MMPAEKLVAARPIPFTLITGFLGAGKTTLINRLLAGQHGLRLAVLVNDFGAINIDKSLIRSRDSETLSLTNGCACCSIAGGLTRTLLRLTEGDQRPDAILLEASGVAEPNAIAHIALSNPSLRLDSVVVVLDAETVRGHAEHGHYGCTVTRQIVAADVAILNKRDLISEEESKDLKAWLCEKNPRCRVIESVQANVTADAVLGLTLPASSLPPIDEPNYLSDHVCNFQSWTITHDKPWDARKLLAIIPQLPAGIIRAKGLLWLSDDPECRHVFQLVGDRWTLERGEPWGFDIRKSELVFIGLQGCADEVNLEHQFASCGADIIGHLSGWNGTDPR